MIGRPEKIDDISRREDALYDREKRIRELEGDVKRLEEDRTDLEKQLSEETEKNLFMKFEKEGVDLKFARL